MAERLETLPAKQVAWVRFPVLARPTFSVGKWHFSVTLRPGARCRVLNNIFLIALPLLLILLDLTVCFHLQHIKVFFTRCDVVGTWSSSFHSSSSSSFSSLENSVLYWLKERYNAKTSYRKAFLF
jgi:hypothetical protein